MVLFNFAVFYECNDGTFGNNCSVNCSNEFPCNKLTGHCDRWCVSGNTGNDAAKVHVSDGFD